MHTEYGKTGALEHIACFTNTAAGSRAYNGGKKLFIKNFGLCVRKPTI